MQQKGKHAPVPTFFLKHVADFKFKMSEYLQITIKFSFREKYTMFIVYSTKYR